MRCQFACSQTIPGDKNKNKRWDEAYHPMGAMKLAGWGGSDDFGEADLGEGIEDWPAGRWARGPQKKKG